MSKLKVLMCVGARPNFIKAAPVIDELRKDKKHFEVLIVHTGQHYTKSMSDQFFYDLKIPRPDINLNVGSSSHAKQTALIMERFEKVLLRERPGLVMVFGDVNSTIACALAATKLNIKVAHVESGLRSFDRAMPEEINRILTDHVSDLLFTTCASADKQLVKEGIGKDKIFFVGNSMIDALRKSRDKIRKRKVLKRFSLEGKKYAVLTLHRPRNVDTRPALVKTADILNAVSEKIPIVFPVHPRALKMFDKYGIAGKFSKNIKLIAPLGYIDFLSLVHDSRMVLTDSGGIQEETTVMKVPCLTLRPNTERPITIKEGSNILVGLNKKKTLYYIDKILRGKYKRKKGVPHLWDGKTAGRIAKILVKELKTAKLET